ncbi:unannotated protein [freshwater metagenome]|uniref:Unannotated protein n=1 Tax=freshwater metagenome TaxID=449393 RepID=A0A6J7HVU9_9ZZZZ
MKKFHCKPAPSAIAFICLTYGLPTSLVGVKKLGVYILFINAFDDAPSRPFKIVGSEPTEETIHVGLNATFAAVPSMFAVAEGTPKNATNSHPAVFNFTTCAANGCTWEPDT